MCVVSSSGIFHSIYMLRRITTLIKCYYLHNKVCCVVFTLAKFSFKLMFLN